MERYAPTLLDLRGEWGDGSRFRLRLGLGAGAGASVFGDGLSHGASAVWCLARITCTDPLPNGVRPVTMR